MEWDARIIKFIGAGLTWLCTLLAVVVAVLGVRSIWRCDEMAYCSFRPAKPDEDFEGVDRRMVFGSYRGGMFCLRTKTQIVLANPGNAVPGPDWYGGEPNELIFSSAPDLRLAESMAWAAAGKNFRPAPRWRRGGFNWCFDSNWPPGCGWVYRAVVAPHWAVFLALSWGPLVLLRRVRLRRRRNRLGLCLGCGYDLRASGDICSECGLPRTPPPRRFPLLFSRLWRWRRPAAVACGGIIVVAVTFGLIRWWIYRPVRLRPDSALSLNHLPQRVELDLGHEVSLRLALIPAGKFSMGSPPNELGRRWISDDETLHEVIITKPFYMGLTTVTQEQYEAVMGLSPGGHKGQRMPVEFEDWNDAVAFCAKVRDHTGRNVRLPTEAQWEYACRAGTNAPFNTGKTLPWDRADYHFGGGYPSNRAGPADWGLLPVASFEPNAWGLYDMHGNICQWCSDWYGPYPSEVVVDPAGPVTGVGRVVRGGDWCRAAVSCRAAARRYGNGNKSLWQNCGLRLAMDP